MMPFSYWGPPSVDRSLLISQTPMEILPYPRLCTTSTLKATMSTWQPSGLSVMSSRIMTGTPDFCVCSTEICWKHIFGCFFFPLSFYGNVIFSWHSLSLHSDKMFPAFGFGAKLPPTWQVTASAAFSHGFCLFRIKAHPWISITCRLTVACDCRSAMNFPSTSIHQIPSVQVMQPESALWNGHQTVFNDTSDFIDLKKVFYNVMIS